jgi:hypothetical protein
VKQIILHLEDDAIERYFSSNHFSIYLRKTIGDEKYILKDFSRIDQAKEYFSENMDEIKCIITDLNMSDEWLEGYESKTEGGMLSGWVWLKEFVYTEKPDMPTVIYSGYISFLEDTLRKNEELHLLYDKQNIICVNKGGDERKGIKELLKALRTLGVNVIGI